MGYYDDDVYYQPEKFGLTPILEINLEDEPYQFHIFAMWRHEDGTVYWATDSGCSCPSPFEDYKSVNDLNEYDYVAIEEYLRDSINSYSSTITEDNIDGYLYDVRRA